jgi:ribosomal protein S18 acetylase RimI-like enzyme
VPKGRLEVANHAVEILPYTSAHRERVLALSLRAWAPVFEKMEPAVQPYVYKAFYPNGWQERQLSEIGSLLDQSAELVSVASVEGNLAGWIGVRIHPDDSMGEIYILAVDPQFQNCGVGSALMDLAFHQIKEAGMAMVMVETGDDEGHAPSRAAYESKGFTRWPVARYFKPL